MLTVCNQIENFSLNYPLEQIAALEKVLFFDIETTGFTARSSSLYLIGCAYYQADCFHICQWFADGPKQEEELLTAFFRFSEKYTHLIHFNGTQFDIPYLLQKCRQLGLPYNFSHLESLDIYKKVTPYKTFLHLPDCKLKTIEAFLGIRREDTYTGGELIQIYQEYLHTHLEHSKQLLLLHNHDDILGLLQTLPILSYHALAEGSITVTDITVNPYQDYAQIARQEILLSLSLPVSLPIEVSGRFQDCYFTGYDHKGTLRLPLYEECLKYFYPNYKDYYYLPAEDTAVHKSVAAYVDKEYRVQATASTCYTTKTAVFLPQWETLYEPCLKRCYKDKESFFELTENKLQDTAFFSSYGFQLLRKIMLAR